MAMLAAPAAGLKVKPDCLRRKADFCFWLATRYPTAGLGAALNKLGLHLITDAKARFSSHTRISPGK